MTDLNNTTTNNNHHPSHPTTTTTNLPSWFPPGTEEVPVTWLPNGAMKSGPKFYQNFYDNDKGLFGWLLFPGVPKKNLKVKVIDNKICVDGFEDVYLKGLPQNMLRVYQGFIFFDHHKFNTSKFVFELVNGIFWVHVPLIKPSTTTTTTTVKTTPDHREHNPVRTVYNGFVKKGYPNHCLFLPVADAHVFRLDVPGIRNSDLRYRTFGSKISVSAKERKPHKFGSGHCEPRRYEVEIEYDMSVYTLDRAKVEVKNGVLCVIVRRIRVGQEDGWVKCYMGSLIIKIVGLGNVEFSDIKTGEFLDNVDLGKKQD